MKRKYLFSLPLIISTILLTGCANVIPNENTSSDNSDDDSSSRQTKEQVEAFYNNYGNKRSYSESYFANPANEYRPLVVNNRGIGEDYGLNPSLFDDYYKMGYGGVVTNYSFGENYLKTESGWENLAENIKYGIDDLGMRIMLYDEDYYPSGKARTLTLEGTPDEYEAQGLYITSTYISSGNIPNPPSVDASSDKGFKIHKIVFYPGVSSISGVTSNASNAREVSVGEYVSESGLVCYFFHKYWYEGTHFANNLMEGCRYIDLMNKEPVTKFINTTYQKYYENFEKYFGNGIESFFFDEPSLPGGYFIPDDNTNYVDPIDENIIETYVSDTHELAPGSYKYYPTLNYDLKIINEFKNEYGYDPTPYMPLLMTTVDSNSAEIKRFRWQYYRLIGKLVSSSFTGNIASWCADHNVVSAGHFLCEETLPLHPLLLGDYSKCYHNMGMPGIDLTSGKVSTPIDIACVAKLATGVAEFDNKQNVFCEIGKDEDNGAETSIEENIANVAIMQSYDVNYLASYYKTYQMSDEDNERFANVLGRINYMMAGNTNEKEVAVYYPIEGVMANTTPYDATKEQRILVNDFSFSDEASLIQSGTNPDNPSVYSYKNLCSYLVKNHIDYSIVASYMFSGENQFIFKNGRMYNPTTGQSFSKLVIPYTGCLEPDTIRALKKAKDAKVKVILVAMPTSLDVQLDAANAATLDALYSEVRNCTDRMSGDSSSEYVVQNVGFDLNEITYWLKSSEVVGFQDGNTNFVVAKQYNGSYKSCVYMLVNTSAIEQNTTIVCNERGSRYLDWNVYTGEVGGMVVNKVGSSSYIDISVPAYGIKIFTID